MQKITADLSKIQLRDWNPVQRVETGAIQINDDWPGIYVRGDNALAFAQGLAQILDYAEHRTDHADIFAVSYLKSLIDLFKSCAIVHEQEDSDPLLEDDEEVGC